MALVGNHGLIIPRDHALLTRLYWDEGKSLPAIGKMFGVTHKSVRDVMVSLGIPTRPKRAFRTGKCIECGAPTVNIKHAVHGYTYGNRCEVHHRARCRNFARKYQALDSVKERRDRYQTRWFARHYYGEYAEVWLLLRDLNTEVLTRATKEEIYAANGRYAARQRPRSRRANPLPLRRESQERPMGNPAVDQVRHDAARAG